MNWGIVGYSLRLTVFMITTETVTGLYFFFLSSQLAYPFSVSPELYLETVIHFMCQGFHIIAQETNPVCFLCIGHLHIVWGYFCAATTHFSGCHSMQSLCSVQNLSVYYLIFYRKIFANSCSLTLVSNVNCIIGY